MNFRSTRAEKEVSASTAILNGIADGGGLYMPTHIPKLSIGLDELIRLSYQEQCFEILKLYFTDFSEEELKGCIQSAYDRKFNTPDIAPLVKAGGNYILELFHGRTSAFKDMALSLHPYLVKTAAKKCGLDKKILILTATSGDTGTAALEGFANIEGIEIVVFYPVDGVSEVQRLQMTTQKGANTHVVAIKGNFDDSQTAVKKVFNDKNLKSIFNDKGYIFSSANSINIGRLFPQVVYYFYAYSQMVQTREIKLGEAINFCVPTGNFGNILAGYYAYKMGLPIGQLICASNVNNILFDFFKTGVYDINREFILTSSPSMDILISSNLERLLFSVCQNSAKIDTLMKNLNTAGKFMFDILKTNICAEYAEESEVFSTIKEMYDSCGYLLDTHTAVAKAAYKKFKKNNTANQAKTVIVSTAHPAKFAKSVLSSLKNDFSLHYNDFDCIRILENEYRLHIPSQIKELRNKKVLHNTVIDKDSISSLLCNLF